MHVVDVMNHVKEINMAYYMPEANTITPKIVALLAEQCLSGDMKAIRTWLHYVEAPIEKPESIEAEITIEIGYEDEEN